MPGLVNNDSIINISKPGLQPSNSQISFEPLKDRSPREHEGLVDMIIEKSYHLDADFYGEKVSDDQFGD